MLENLIAIVCCALFVAGALTLIVPLLLPVCWPGPYDAETVRCTSRVLLLSLTTMLWRSPFHHQKLFDADKLGLVLLLVAVAVLLFAVR